jgi:hypothetical protein
MSAPNITRWIGIGLLGLPLYGVLTFFSSLDPQPDPNTHYDAWARYVTTDSYVLTHLFLSDLGLILAIFGTFALGAYLARSRAGRMGLVAMAITAFGSLLFLLVGGVHLLFTRAGAYAPAGHRGLPRDAYHLGAERDDGDLRGVLPTDVGGQRAPRGSGLALWDAAKVGGGPLGRWLRPPRAGYVVRVATDRR